MAAEQTYVASRFDPQSGANKRRSIIRAATESKGVHSGKEVPVPKIVNISDVRTPLQL